MYRRAREREELIAEFEFRAATHVIDARYEEDSDGDMFQEASMLAFAVRTVLESVREDKREDHPGRPDAYFLAMDPTHFEEVFRAERSDLVAISSRLRFPVDARGNVTATGTSQRRCKRASFSLGYEMAAWLMVRCARRAPCLLLS